MVCNTSEPECCERVSTEAAALLRPGQIPWLQVRGRRKRVTETALPARLARAVYYSGKKEGGSMDGRPAPLHVRAAKEGQQYRTCLIPIEW